MIPLSQIRYPIENELHEFEIKFREAMKSKVALLDTIMAYIVKRKGKQMRPMFVFLSAKIFGEVNESTYRGAALIELLHTATLVHDDIVDNANERRGFFSINALWKNKIAVLVGDYLLAKGLLLSLNNSDFRLLQIVSRAVKEMSEGELLQIEKTRKLDIKEEIYFDIIRQKTASLIASACACGVASVLQDEKIIEQARLLGEKIGIAFQIKDDLFDFGNEDTGKPKGLDISEKKMTLPLIYALKNASYQDKKRIINIVKNHSGDNKNVQEVINFVVQTKGIKYANDAMEKFKNDAFQILKTFPANKAKTALEQLVIYTIERKK